MLSWLSPLLVLFASPLEACFEEPPPVTAITEVTVIPMDRERVLERQTVLLRHGRIAAIAPADEAEIPDGARRIDGAGRFLIPGLMDMHAHLLSDYALPDACADDELFLMLSQGVTTARMMIGTPEHLQLRRAVRTGRMQGPRLFVASPQLCGREFGEYFNGIEVRTPEQAREAVRTSVAAGYDFIKLTFFLTPPIYEAAVDEAREQGIRVVGHIGAQVGLQRAFEAGQQIEHLDQYFEALLPEDAPMRGSVSGVAIWRPQAWRSLDHLDEARIDALARETVERGIWNTPTLNFLNYSFGLGLPDESLQGRAELRFYPDEKLVEMKAVRDRFWNHPPQEAWRQKFVLWRNRLAKALYEAGAKLMVGSDAPDWWLLYGFGVHRELESFVDAGIPPYGALEAATRAPAEYLGIAADAGTIKVGKRADLVLLDANPLENIRHSNAIHGVFVSGEWISAERIQSELARISKRFKSADPARSFERE